MASWGDVLLGLTPQLAKRGFPVHSTITVGPAQQADRS
jgi:hypothetical protein